MDKMLPIALAAFAVYILIFIFLLNRTLKSNKNYSPLSFWVSNLGELKSHNHRLFNASVFFFGLLSLFFVYGFSKLLPDIFSSQIALFFLYLLSFSAMLATLIPMDRNFGVHHLFSRASILGIMGAALFLIKPMYVSIKIPGLFLLFNVSILLFGTVLSLSLSRLKKKYGTIPRNLTEVTKTEESLLIKNVAILEWILFLLAILWFLSLDIFTLLNFL